MLHLAQRFLKVSPTPAEPCAFRALTEDDEPFLWDMLYYAIFVPEHAPPPERSIVHHPDLAKYVKGWSRQHDDGLAALSTAERRSIGAAWWRLFTHDDPGYGYVDDQTPELAVAVLPGHRNHGVGTRLLTQLLQEARTQYQCVSLSVSAAHPARRLSQRLGFQEIGGRGMSVTMRIDLSTDPRRYEDVAQSGRPAAAADR